MSPIPPAAHPFPLRARELLNLSQTAMMKNNLQLTTKWGRRNREGHGLPPSPPPGGTNKRKQGLIPVPIQTRDITGDSELWWQPLPFQTLLVSGEGPAHPIRQVGLGSPSQHKLIFKRSFVGSGTSQGELKLRELTFTECFQKYEYDCVSSPALPMSCLLDMGEQSG